MILCDNCKAQIEPLKVCLRGRRIEEIKNLTFKDFTETSKASGGRRFLNRRYKVEVFIDYCNNARLMFTGEGRWITSINFVEEPIEKIFEALLKTLPNENQA